MKNSNEEVKRLFRKCKNTLVVVVSLLSNMSRAKRAIILVVPIQYLQKDFDKAIKTMKTRDGCLELYIRWATGGGKVKDNRAPMATPRGPP